MYKHIFDDGSSTMCICQGKQHDFLCMHLDFSTKGWLALTMFPYIKEVVKDFTEYDMSSRTTKTPASDHLFQVNPDAELLSQTEKAMFHNFIARALFLTKQACPDITTVVAFLTTCITNPNQDDWKKLIHLL